MNSPLGLSSDAFAFALRFCYLSFVLCFALFSLFAVWFLFLCGCTFYVHKRISLNTKTTCGNSNNNKAKTHAHKYTDTHTNTSTARDTRRGQGQAGGCSRVYMIDKATAKTAKALHLIISQSDRETVSRGRGKAGGRRGTEKRAKRRQKTNTARTASRPHNKTETHIHIWQHASVCVCLCVCVFVACWLSNDIREAVAIPAVCFLCIVIRPMEAGTYVFLFDDDDDDDGCVPQQAVCHMAAAQVGICSILFGGFVLLANPLPRQHTAAQCKMRDEENGKGGARERERACKVIKYLNGLPWQRLHRRLSNAFVMAH